MVEYKVPTEKVLIKGTNKLLETLFSWAVDEPDEPIPRVPAGLHWKETDHDRNDWSTRMNSFDGRIKPKHLVQPPHPDALDEDDISLAIEHNHHRMN